MAGDPPLRASGSSGTGTGTRSTEVYGARWFVIGTIVTAFGAMVIAAPLAVAIGLFLSELAPHGDARRRSGR